MDLGTYPVPIEAFPVEVIFKIDGDEVWRRSFASAMTTIMNITGARSSSVRPPRVQAGVNINIKLGELRSITSITDPRLSIVSSDGAVRLDRGLELPDWPILQAEALRVGAELERDRLGQRCELIAVVT